MLFWNILGVVGVVAAVAVAAADGDGDGNGVRVLSAVACLSLVYGRTTLISMEMRPNEDIADCGRVENVCIRWLTQNEHWL